MFCTIGVLKYFTKFTGKQLCQSLFFNKVGLFNKGLRPETLLKIRRWHRCFSVSFVTSFLSTILFRTPLVAASVATCLYRSPSQTSNEFGDFCKYLNLFLSSNVNDLNPACSVITRDFSATPPQWRSLDKKIGKGAKLVSFCLPI